MIHLSAEDVAALLPYGRCIGALEDALAAPVQQGVLSIGHFHAKAALQGRYYAIKINGNFPGNDPTIQGILYLADASNGTPLAIMDSIEITKRRTAAASALAAKWLAKNPATVAIIGWGVQGPAHVDALRAVLDVRRVTIYDIDPARSTCASIEEAVRDADVVVTCTTSRDPILFAVRPGTFVAAVGADHPEKRELSSSLMQSSRIITDVRSQALAFGELHHCPSLPSEELRDRPRRRSPDETIIFDSTGMALEDVAAAAIVYEAALTHP